VEKMPRQRQTLLFSATYPDEIQAIAQRIMVEPEIIQITQGHDNSSIEQVFYQLDRDDSLITALRLLLLEHQPESTLVFCNTKRETSEVCEQLCSYGFSALALHGDLEQKQREQILVRFANKSASILVATDVAARGLDIDSLDAVINYHIARELEVHVHRIGRTGRAGSKGLACTLFSEKERFKLEKLEQFLQQTLTVQALPATRILDRLPFEPPMVTLQIDGGKKQKVRPGDILGALTGDKGIAGKQVGKIQIFDNCAYVAVVREAAKAAVKKLADGKLKGRSFRVRQIRD
jgi:ATP-independent RNA helicase DbpA